MLSTALLDFSKTCNRSHHGIPPDRNLDRIIGVNLPALLLSKSVYPDPVRASAFRWDLPDCSGK